MLKTVIEILLMTLMVLNCLYASFSDLRTGLIPNRIILYFLVPGLVLDSFYYGFLVRDLIPEFLGNVGLVTLAGIILFYSHSLAGGDVKLMIVLSCLYPARFYIAYSGSILTVVFAVFLAIIFGYIYLLFSSIWRLLIGQNNISYSYVKGYLQHFFASYGRALVYISALNAIFIIAEVMGVQTPIWMIYGACLGTSLCIGRIPLLRKKEAVLIALAVIIVSSIWTHTLPFSLNPESYYLALLLMLFQMLIRTNLYEEIPISSLRSGMILSMAASIPMQASITKNLPKISTENLKSRLTSDEVDSVQKWAKAVHVSTISIVRKIPFGLFIAMGFINYFLLWRFQI